MFESDLRDYVTVINNTDVSDLEEEPFESDKFVEDYVDSNVGNITVENLNNKNENSVNNTPMQNIEVNTNISNRESSDLIGKIFKTCLFAVFAGIGGTFRNQEPVTDNNLGNEQESSSKDYPNEVATDEDNV